MIPSSVADLCISQFDLAGYRGGYLGSSDICGRLLGSLHSHEALNRLSLHFESPLAANITDADLAAITSKWKNLVTLEITYRQCEEGRARVAESGTLPRVQTVAAFAIAPTDCSPVCGVPPSCSERLAGPACHRIQAASRNITT